MQVMLIVLLPNIISHEVLQRKIFLGLNTPEIITAILVVRYY